MKYNCVVFLHFYFILTASLCAADSGNYCGQKALDHEYLIDKGPSNDTVLICGPDFDSLPLFDSFPNQYNVKSTDLTKIKGL